MALVKFDIPTRSRRCALGDENFTQGMEYVSVLEDAENEGFFRKDYCVPCWKKLLLNSETNSFGKMHWKSSVPIKKQESQSSLRRYERAMELLKEIHQSEGDEEASEAFVLALLLARKKILQLRQELVEDDGQTILLYEEVATEEMLGVRKIDLSHIQSEKIQSTLAHKLNVPEPMEEVDDPEESENSTESDNSEEYS